jgi:hypothetical protein
MLRGRSSQEDLGSDHEEVENQPLLQENGAQSSARTQAGQTDVGAVYPASMNVEKGISGSSPALDSPSRSLSPGSGPFDPYLHRLYSIWRDRPSAIVSFRDLSVTFTAPVQASSMAQPASQRETLLSVWTGRWRPRNPFGPSPPVGRVAALRGLNGVCPAGSMTLIMGPPGCGKSVLLKSLSAQPLGSNATVGGSICWNGLDAAQCSARNINLNKVCSFVDQGDVHLPTITVRETLEFAFRNSVPDASIFKDPQLEQVGTPSAAF